MLRKAFIGLALLASLASGRAGDQTNPLPATNAGALAVRAEAARSACIQGRRVVCGRILKVLPDGLLVESGYTSLLRPPVDQSWLVPGTVVAAKDPNLVEANEPDAMLAGLVFLVDLPRSRQLKPKAYDYVHLAVYPAGHYTYALSGDQHKDLRRFSAGLETAVRLNLSAEPKPGSVVGTNGK